MAQVMISDQLYNQLQATARAHGVTLDALVQETLESIENLQAPLTLQEEQLLFEQLDRLAQKNASISGGDWGRLIIDMRDS